LVKVDKKLKKTNIGHHEIVFEKDFF